MVKMSSEVYDYLEQKCKESEDTTIDEYIYCWDTSKSFRNKLLGKLNKGKKKKVFITYQNFKFHTIEDLEKMKIFMSKIDWLFDDWKWIIEHGKNEKPNYHFHILGAITESKNFKRNMGIEFNKIFNLPLHPKSTDYYNMRQWNKSDKMPPYDQWVSEKLDYFNNDIKGNHSNWMDIKAQGP